MTRNVHRIVGRLAFITLTDRSGASIGEAVIDADRIERIIAFGRWRRLGNGYVGTTRFSGGRRQDVYLHRLLADAPKGLVVDHINGDPLDNRLGNLRILTRAQNMQNLQGARSDSGTGVRNVFLCGETGKYRVEVGRVALGRYSDLAEAERVAERYRKSLFPYSSQ